MVLLDYSLTVVVRVAVGGSPSVKLSSRLVDDVFVQSCCAAVLLQFASQQQEETPVVVVSAPRFCREVDSSLFYY
jgi:predicted HD phosphohydrolase